MTLQFSLVVLSLRCRISSTLCSFDELHHVRLQHNACRALHAILCYLPLPRLLRTRLCRLAPTNRRSSRSSTTGLTWTDADAQDVLGPTVGVQDHPCLYPQGALSSTSLPDPQALLALSLPRYRTAAGPHLDCDLLLSSWPLAVSRRVPRDTRPSMIPIRRVCVPKACYDVVLTPAPPPPPPPSPGATPSPGTLRLLHSCTTRRILADRRLYLTPARSSLSYYPASRGPIAHACPELTVASHRSLVAPSLAPRTRDSSSTSSSATRLRRSSTTPPSSPVARRTQQGTQCALHASAVLPPSHPPHPPPHPPASAPTSDSTGPTPEHNGHHHHRVLSTSTSSISGSRAIHTPSRGAAHPVPAPLLPHRELDTGIISKEDGSTDRGPRTVDTDSDSPPCPSVFVSSAILVYGAARPVPVSKFHSRATRRRTRYGQGLGGRRVMLFYIVGFRRAKGRRRGASEVGCGMRCAQGAAEPRHPRYHFPDSLYRFSIDAPRAVAGASLGLSPVLRYSDSPHTSSRPTASLSTLCAAANAHLPPRCSLAIPTRIPTVTLRSLLCAHLQSCYVSRLPSSILPATETCLSAIDAPRAVACAHLLYSDSPRTFSPPPRPTSLRSVLHVASLRVSAARRLTPVRVCSPARTPTRQWKAEAQADGHRPRTSTRSWGAGIRSEGREMWAERRKRGIPITIRCCRPPRTHASPRLLQARVVCPPRLGHTSEPSTYVHLCYGFSTSSAVLRLPSPASSRLELSMLTTVVYSCLPKPTARAACAFASKARIIHRVLRSRFAVAETYS
ncbi:hypothetical protein DFH06DRAFT_1371639 [Mycena polygramma]|nr:hypothetical protein DFH06DRAFT_1371639 [Mycena polygramma]